MKRETRGRKPKAPEDKIKTKYTRLEESILQIAAANADREGITTRKWIEKTILNNDIETQSQ